MPEALRDDECKARQRNLVRAWGPPQTKTETRTEPNPNRGKPTKPNRTKPKHEKSETISQTTVLIAIYTYTNPKERRNKRMTPTISAAETAGTLDISLVGTLIDLCKNVMGLFNIFPLNLFLVAGLVGVGFRIFTSAKSAARS
jgi:hypothetical protein